MARRKLSAFTLIELLVVISIIALLVSILLPALNAARDIAKRVMCSADQRSIGLAFHNYSYDNKGTIPPMSSPQGQAWYAYRAYEWNIKRIDDPTELRPLNTAYLVETGLLPDHQILYCPGQIGLSDKSWSRWYSYEKYTDPVTGEWIKPDGTESKNRTRISYLYWTHGIYKPDKLSARAYLYDNMHHWEAIPHRSSGQPKGLSVLFGDNHVEFVTGNTGDDELYGWYLWHFGGSLEDTAGPGDHRELQVPILELLEKRDLTGEGDIGSYTDPKTLIYFQN